MDYTNRILRPEELEFIVAGPSDSSYLGSSELASAPSQLLQIFPQASADPLSDIHESLFLNYNPAKGQVRALFEDIDLSYADSSHPPPAAVSGQDSSSSC